MTQEQTMALGAEVINDVFGDSDNTLSHYGTKGMKWGNRKLSDSIPSNANLRGTIDEKMNFNQPTTKSSGGGGGGAAVDGGKDISAPKDADTTETDAEKAARNKVVDDFLKSKGKGDKKKAGAKGGGGGAKKGGGKGGKGGKGGSKKSSAGGKKKAAAKKSNSGSSSSSSDSSSSSVSSLVSTLSPKTTYATRKSITSILAAMPKSKTRVIPENPRAKAIIAEINAKVAARKAASTVEHSDLTSNDSLDTLDDILAHFGVQGMKWGVRKNRVGVIKARATMSRRDRKDWAFTATPMNPMQQKAINKTYRKAAGKIRKGTRQLNNDPKFKGQDFRKPSPLRKEYYNAYSKLVSSQLNAAAIFKGKSPKGRYQLHFDFNVMTEATPRVTIRQVDTRLGRREERADAREVRKLQPVDTTDSLKHADTTDTLTEDYFEFEIKLITDDQGYIIGLDIPGMDAADLGEEDSVVDDEDILMQNDSMEDILMHYGVMGMKWGVRNDDRGIGGTTKLLDWGRTANSGVKIEEKLKPGIRDFDVKRLSIKEQIAIVNTTLKIRKELWGHRGPLENGTVRKLHDEALKKVHALDPNEDENVHLEHLTKIYDDNSKQVEKAYTDFAKSRTPKGLTAKVIMDTSTASMELVVGDPYFVDEYTKALSHSVVSYGTQSTFKLLFDSDGFLIGGEFVKEDLGIEIEHMQKLDDQIIDEQIFEQLTENELMHYGVMGMKWGVRNTDAPAMPAFGGGGSEDEDEKLIAELIAKGLTIEEIFKTWNANTENAKKTLDDIQAEFDKYDEDAVYPWENVNDGAERRNRARNRRIDRERAAEKASPEYQQKSRNEKWRKDHGGGIKYNGNFPTYEDDFSGRYLPINHSEGGAMTNENKELIAVDSMDKILAHYGILGMKWGIRNDTRSSGRPQGGTSKKKAPLSSVKKLFGSKSKISEPSADTKPGTSANNQSTNSQSTSNEVAVSRPETNLNGPLTDEDLRVLINRLQMEKTYKQLLAERTPVVAKRTENVITKILKDSTKQAAGQILTNTFKVVGTYAMAAIVAKNSPGLANALMKGMGDAAAAAKAKADAKDEGRAPGEEAPDATVHTPKTNNQSPSWDAANKKIEAVATKMTNDIMSTMPKPASQNESSPTYSDAGKKKAAAEVDSSSRTSSKPKESFLDIPSTRGPEADPNDVTAAYNRAAGNEVSPAVQKILDEMAKVRKP